jgi:hypothetical protein
MYPNSDVIRTYASHSNRNFIVYVKEDSRFETGYENDTILDIFNRLRIAEYKNNVRYNLTIIRVKQQ